MQVFNELKTKENRVVTGIQDYSSTLLSKNPFDEGFDIYMPQESFNVHFSKLVTSSTLKDTSSLLRKKDREISLAIRDLKRNQNKFQFNNLGVVFIRYNGFRKAKTCFELALKLDENFLQAKQNLAKVHQHLGDMDSANKIYYDILEKIVLKLFSLLR